MSKTSPKQRLEQLKEWLAWKGIDVKKRGTQPQSRFSKAKHYKKNNAR